MTPQSSDLPHLPHETSGTPTKEDLRPEVLFGKLSLASPQELTQVASLLRDVSRRYYTDIDGLSKLSGLSKATLFRRIRAGQLHPEEMYIRRTVFNEREVLRFLKTCIPELAVAPLEKDPS